MAEPSTKMKKTSSSSSSSSMIPDWSRLPKELLHIISQKVENCFDIVHARSVCSSWRSVYPFPDCLLRPSYSFPSLNQLPFKSEGLCTFKKIPLFLFRVRAPSAEYFLGGISRDESEDNRMELLSPIQCSVKVKLPRSDPTLMNMVDCQILPLGHQYRMIGWDPDEDSRPSYRGVAFLPLNEGGGEFVVLINFTKVLLVLRSAEMRWMRLQNVTDYSCEELVTFRGRFYAVFHNRGVLVINPYSLEVTPLEPLQPLIAQCYRYLVPSGNDELFLVQKIIPRTHVLDLIRYICKVSRLDEEAGKWVEVSELGDRVLFVGQFGNVSCLAKELPDSCGLSGNSIVFINEPGNVTYSYKYGVHTGREEDDLNCWRYSKENPVTVLHRSPIVSLRVQC